jgi:UDP-N-acetyl-D-mannosaminuronate dehydrogenase
VATDSLESALDGARAVVIATNHSEFERVLAQVPRDAWLVDPWNITGSGQVFAFVEELAPAKAPS